MLNSVPNMHVSLSISVPLVSASS